MKKVSQWAGIWLVISALMGCAPVEPWQRGTLAKAQMQASPQPMQSLLRRHVQNSREAATATDPSTAGGGCGCF